MQLVEYLNERFVRLRAEQPLRKLRALLGAPPKNAAIDPLAVMCGCQTGPVLAVAERQAERGGEIDNVAISPPKSLREHDRDVARELKAESLVVCRQPLEVFPPELEQFALGRFATKSVAD